MFENGSYLSTFGFDAQSSPGTVATEPRDQECMVLLVCASGLVRRGLKHVLGEVCLTRTTMVEVANVKDLLAQGDRIADAHFVLIDIDECGLPALRELCALATDSCGVIALTASASHETIDVCDRLGVKGLLTKCMPEAQMGLAADLVLMGGAYYPRLKSNGTAAPVFREDPAPSYAAAMQIKLTDREVEVLSHVLNGVSNKAIARNLDIALGTVKNYVAALLRKSGASSRQQLISTLLRGQNA